MELPVGSYARWHGSMHLLDLFAPHSEDLSQVLPERRCYAPNTHIALDHSSSPLDGPYRVKIATAEGRGWGRPLKRPRNVPSY